MGVRATVAHPAHADGHFDLCALCALVPSCAYLGLNRTSCCGRYRYEYGRAANKYQGGGITEWFKRTVHEIGTSVRTLTCLHPMWCVHVSWAIASSWACMPAMEGACDTYLAWLSLVGDVGALLK